MVPKQLVIRSIATNSAGLGSVVAQLRSSFALASMLDADFATFPLLSEHDYRAASLLGLDRLPWSLAGNTTLCAVSASLPLHQTRELIDTWCSSTRSDPSLAEERAVQLQQHFSGCGVILDDRPWDVRYDMSMCTWEWVRRIFSDLGPGLRDRQRGIGLHIRWGDMSVSTLESDPITQERSTPIDVAARLLRKLRECGVEDELSVYMELHNATMLEGLGEAYRIVDTGDSVADLIDLASNRIMVLDISSYTVLAHQMAGGGLSIVPDEDRAHITWHDNGVNSVLRWNEVLSTSCAELHNIMNH